MYPSYIYLHNAGTQYTASQDLGSHAVRSLVILMGLIAVLEVNLTGWVFFLASIGYFYTHEPTVSQ